MERLTAECLQPFQDLLEIIRLNVTHVCHEICHLYRISNHKRRFDYYRVAHVASAVADLLVHVVGTEDLVDYSNVSIIVTQGSWTVCLPFRRTPGTFLCM